MKNRPKEELKYLENSVNLYPIVNLTSVNLRNIGQSLLQMINIKKKATEQNGNENIMKYDADELKHIVKNIESLNIINSIFTKKDFKYEIKNGNKKK